MTMHPKAGDRAAATLAQPGSWLRAEQPWAVTVVLGLALSAALAALSYYTVERWALRLRDGGGRARRPAPLLLPPTAQTPQRSAR